MAFNQQEYNNRYNSEKYDRITIMLAKGSRERLQELAKASGQSVTAYIKQAIAERIAKDEGGNI